MKNKIMSLLLLGLLFAAPLVIAQENYDVPVTAGDTVVSDMIAYDEQDSTTDGGIVSQIQSEFRRAIRFLGVKVSEVEIIEQEETFEVYAFPAGLEIDFNSIVIGDEYKSSLEDVDVRGVVGTWLTNEITADAVVDQDDASQVPFEYDTEVTFEDATILTITGQSGGAYAYTYEGSNYDSTVRLTCDYLTTPDEICPDIADLENVYDVVFDIDNDDVMVFNMTDISDCTNGVYFNDADDGSRFVIDYDKDCSLEFGQDTTSTTGYMSEAFSGQNLLLLPINIYDVYGAF